MVFVWQISLPFYRILGDWDEMDAGGDLEVDKEDTTAYQEARISLLS